MKRTYIGKQLSALLATALLSSAVFAQEAKVTIPQGTQITARLANQLDSGQVKAGDPVTMDVLEDLKIGSLVAIPHGAIVMGHVIDAKGARKMGRGGRLDISFETVTAGDGTKVPVSGQDSAKGKGGYGGGSVVAGGAAGLIFPPAAALLLLKHGHASVIPVGTVLTVHVTADTSVAGTHPVFVPPPTIVPAQTSYAQAPATIHGAIISGTVDQTPQQQESLGDLARRLQAEKAAKH